MSREMIQTIFARRSIRKYTAEPVGEEGHQDVAGGGDGGPLRLEHQALALCRRDRP